MCLNLVAALMVRVRGAPPTCARTDRFFITPGSEIRVWSWLSALGQWTRPASLRSSFDIFSRGRRQVPFGARVVKNKTSSWNLRVKLLRVAAVLLIAASIAPPARPARRCWRPSQANIRRRSHLDGYLVRQFERGSHRGVGAAQHQPTDATRGLPAESLSPNYHQWLTTEQFIAKFGPTEDQIAALAGWPQLQGFTVTAWIGALAESILPAP
jgi:hypothetical protein